MNPSPAITASMVATAAGAAARDLWVSFVPDPYAAPSVAMFVGLATAYVMAHLMTRNA